MKKHPLGALKSVYNRLKKALGQPLREYQYRGKNVECPCCERTFRDFAPIQAVTVRKGGCPHCSSRERHRMMMLHLKKQTTLFSKGGRMLHVAPEPFLQKLFKQIPGVEHTSIDLDSAFADLKMDLTRMTFEDSSFDYIICSHVLEHIPDDVQAMKELFRVLKPGGHAVLLVPMDSSRETTDEDFTVTDPQERIRRFGQDDHVRIYGRDYFTRLESAGFNVNHQSCQELYTAEQLVRYGLMPSEQMIYGKK
jgi:SAM-dependent methyltransferase